MLQFGNIRRFSDDARVRIGLRFHLASFMTQIQLITRDHKGLYDLLRLAFHAIFRHQLEVDYAGMNPYEHILIIIGITSLLNAYSSVRIENKHWRVPFKSGIIIVDFAARARACMRGGRSLARSGRSLSTFETRVAAASFSIFTVHRDTSSESLTSSDRRLSSTIG